MKIININHLIAVLKEVRGDHGLEIPVIFESCVDQESTTQTISVKVHTTQEYQDTVSSSKNVVISLI